MVELVGLERRMQSFQLPHKEYCEKVGKCSCTKRVVLTTKRDKMSGKRSVVKREQMMPTTISVRFMKSVSVHEAALSCPGIVSALSAKPRRLRVKR